jgi:hypothetical protein
MWAQRSLTSPLNNTPLELQRGYVRIIMDAAGPLLKKTSPGFLPGRLTPGCAAGGREALSAEIGAGNFRQ